ncbi:MAG: DUF177 domain-containing protein [Sphingomonadaceae bacterium]|nr:DUF177 domain-containing protein [Sphingomonadaceae bacterium]
MTRMVKRKPLPAEPVEVIATESERAALARRFGISAVERFVARVDLAEDGGAVTAEGMLEADLIQPCAISGEDFPVSVRDTVVMRFVQSRGDPVEPDAEIELADEELDEIEYDGEMFDLGEALAQSLALAIDPYAEGPNADAARKAAGIVSDEAPRGALADALAALKKG